MSGLAHSPEAASAHTRPMPTDVLPHPIRMRWQPLRLGLVDLFHYDDEQFWFHDGRLLLRGNNGTGKSKVLALTLPFVLDGSILPRRVEPDADPKKRMEWNLLLGGVHASSERTGYAWVEFGRVDADGTEHFTTLGIGLKAATGRGIVKMWHFICSRRIGDLRLIDDQRVVLTQERLRDELAETHSGHVHPTQQAYRRAVDETLFRLGEARYTALIDLLIQLRQPQLSRNHDQRALSAALTEALTPLDQAVVADVAESFRSLEEEQTGIADAKETLAAAEEFLRHYRAYATVAARRHTTAVREANSAYEWAGRNLRDAEQELRLASAEAERLDGVHRELTMRKSGLDGERDALRESPAMRDAARLDEAGTAAHEMAARVTAAADESARARATARRDADAEAEAAARHGAAVAESGRRDEASAARATPAGLASEHPALVADEGAAARALDRRRDQVRHIRRLAERRDTAATRTAQFRDALDQADAEAAQRAEVVSEAEAAAETAVTTHVEAVVRYLAGLTLLEIPGDLREPTETWARSLAGEAPARSAIDTAARLARERFGRRRADAEQRHARLAAELAELRDRIAALETGRDPEPPATPGREAAGRAGRAGAPLWRLTDFAEHVTDEQRAGTEAALASSGLLDAWIFPDGTLSVDGDVVLGPGGPPVSPAIDGVLVPASGVHDEVGADVIAGVLAQIGAGAASGAALWVDVDGCWGAGPARGSWSKQRAEFVGAGAREAHRRAMLTTLRTAEERLAGELESAHDDIEAAQELIERAGREQTAYPSESERALFSTDAAAASARRELDRAQAKAVQAHERWQRAAEAEAAARSELTEQAAEFSLGTTRDDLDRVGDALTAYQLSLVEARTARRAMADAMAAHDQARERVAESASLAARREADEAALGDRAAELQARFETLQATVGASVAELQAKLSVVGSALEQVSDELRRNGSDRLTASAKVGRLDEKVRGLETHRDETEQARRSHIEGLRAFADTGLLRIALPGTTVPDSGAAEEWGLTATLALARRAEQQLDAVDESGESWARAQQRVSSASTELTSQMSARGHTAVLEQRDDVMVARVRHVGDEVAIDELAERLAADVADRERLLSAREREILENHLVNEVAGHLHELLLAAVGQIDGMNRELALRKTSTGMQLRVRWRDRRDGPAGLASARELMLRSDATWTPSDRSAIGEFLQGQIAEFRQAYPAGSWQEHLERALDYRHWHEFTVERLQNGQWRPASGPASTGEKALTVSVPLFAAAAAHYNSASPTAPRLILLDEAFAGIDDDARATSLGLLATFDLDVVMTSEREWGCYPQVPGLSIAQLSRVDGVDAVGVTRWRWDGRRRERQGEPAPAALASGTTQAPASDGPTLFG